ncbi:hypothetical protein NEUTE1DRAFT_119071 [Neurospora tetrasperma FGSC 2508]|uniref:Uncharacterized protein n=1 Tax=Neurospora tetrasperma (strain FGSC 2508 / ATCC MYA-4615 / P0657) TaxID=510951 RepID=F8N1C4_NEUT8|nr:uncharacterized protein NEUTE1DRAFT_119071 [Neurospora tetrasperma FGSC 2508]EGO53104.1 hypothetical protein NEUTE1DRAFT_119071 [Neurospora tetrasperma FGSC 2508]
MRLRCLKNIPPPREHSERRGGRGGGSGNGKQSYSKTEDSVPSGTSSNIGVWII